MKKILKLIIAIFIIVSLFVSNTLVLASDMINSIEENYISNEIVNEKEIEENEDNNVNEVEEQIGKVERLKTGDIPIIVFRILLVVSIIGIIILLIKKKKRHKPKRHKPKQKKQNKKRKIQSKDIKK